MEAYLWFKLILILILILGNAYFVGAEVAITGARRSKIRNLAEGGNKAAQRVQELHQEPERFYSVTQIGITIVSLALGAIGMDTLALIMDPWFENLFSIFGSGEELMKTARMISYMLAFCIISFLHVVGGELAPKILAFHKAEAVAMAVSWSVNVQYVMWTPVIWAMKHASNFLLWTWGQGDLIGSHGEHFTMTQDEIRTIITASEGAGVLKPEDTKMIHGIIDMGERTVRSAMVPRTDILAFHKDTTLMQALSKFRDVPHARYLVYENNLDNILGYVAMKELLSVMAESKETLIDRPITEYVNPCYIVPNSKRLRDLLKEFKANRQQLAVVIDEYGGTEGIITLEDILEEIVGDYEDEFTQGTRRVKKMDNDAYVIDASMRIAELGSVLNYIFPLGEDYITIGGLIYHQLGHVPVVEDAVILPGARIAVLEMDNHRITKVKFQHIAPPSDSPEAMTQGEIRIPESGSSHG
ncbi:MAG: HlyC/CorC family transporter [Magnetococcales bacterium]|nr:HlyC/CorC family transporter [Magnetococcales bacterium]NGZ07306.1 HlyC/CorC family transporter [Magnetococcales bacterium]